MDQIPTRDYRRVSYWLESCGDDLTPRPGLDGSIDVDVAILGAGFTGLWTAYYLKNARPELSIAVVEREIAGFGASGRNGGFVTPGLQVSLGKLAARFGRERARAQQLALFETVDEVGRVAAEEGIDCGYHKGGYLRVARGPHQLASLEQSARSAAAFGLADHYQRLDATEATERVQIAGTLGATFNSQCALIQPAKLVRGLARVAERLGVTIYEGTPVTDFEAGASPKLITPRGEVRARTLVLAGESYLTRLAKLHRQLIPVYSLITLTEPLSQADWQEIGWEGRECLSSPRLTVDYLSKTADGRIAFGGRGAPYHYDSKIADEYDRHEPTHEALRQETIEWFPRLKDVKFTHSWGGPLGMPRDWLPTMSYDRASGIASSRGYTGQGVATANLAGRVLTDLILERQSDLTELPVVNHQSPDWEPEPLRWLGVRYVQRGFQRIDEQAERSGRAPNGRTLVERLGSH